MCTVPINIVSDISSNITLSDLNISYGRGVPITIGTVDVPFRVTSGVSGIINITNVSFVYLSKDDNITVVVKILVSPSVNETKIIEVTYSNYSVEIIPHGIDEWDISPNLYSPTQTDVPPFGNYNGDGNPFFNVTSYAPKNMSIYIMYNTSISSCINTYFNEILVNNSAKALFINLTYGDTYNITSLSNLSCSWDEAIDYSYFRFIGICDECTRTSDWQNMNVVIE